MKIRKHMIFGNRWSAWDQGYSLHNDIDNDCQIIIQIIEQSM